MLGSLDVTVGSLDVTEEPMKAVERMHAIRALLCDVSPVFYEMFATADPSTVHEDVVVPDCTPLGFLTMLRYICTKNTRNLINDTNLMDTM